MGKLPTILCWRSKASPQAPFWPWWGPLREFKWWVVKIMASWVRFLRFKSWLYHFLAVRTWRYYSMLSCLIFFMQAHLPHKAVQRIQWVRIYVEKEREYLERCLAHNKYWPLLQWWWVESHQLKCISVAFSIKVKASIVDRFLQVFLT